ncbi:hypothetical protein ACLMJK_002278 [Lecanora helva]
MVRILTLLSALIVLCHATPANLGLTFDERANAMPTLTLPYATYKAASYNPDGDIYTFKNIRFAAAPVGDLRWSKPAPPAHTPGTQDGSYGPICVQVPPAPGTPGALPSTASQDEGKQAGSRAGRTSLNLFRDCLFLDVYVPAAAIKNPSLKLPVISWIYGGAYVFGGKDSFGPALPFYDGTGLIQESGGNVGAYGFLAGTSMEEQGLPNAGLYDQRAAFQWIQNYIHLVGGDPASVSAWGQSAGAGSIMHQLVAFGGSQASLFSKAVMQSPAFALKVDRKGDLEQVFQNFTQLTGCSGQGVACLRAASAQTLQRANSALNQEVPAGTFAVGPSADGNLIRQSPALELASGNFDKKIDSLILSHVSDEAFIFVPPNVRTDNDFNHFVQEEFPAYAQSSGVNAAIEARYPPVMNASVHNYTTEFDRVKAVLSESSFVCNIRYLTDAYDGKNYNIQYSVTPGLHATDLVPTFYNLNLDLPALSNATGFPLVPGFGSFAQAYQSYLISHARSGDPNTYKKTINVPPAITWPKPISTGDEISGVLNAGDTGFSVISDSQTRESTCEFWREVAAAITNFGGRSSLDIRIFEQQKQMLTVGVL